MVVSSNAHGTGVALILGIGQSVGASAKAIALLLSAHGVAIIVLGENERALGEVVGEIVYGGGRARHVVGDPRVAEHLGAGIDKARSVFGEGELMVVACTETPAEIMAALAPALLARGIASEAVFLGPRDGEPEALAQRIAALAARP